MKINIIITLSKIMAYIILIIGSTYAFIYKDATVLIATFSAAATIIAIKTYTSRKNNLKE